MIDRICIPHRGKAVGGTTVINGLFYSRGSRLDYDKWAADGNPGWSYKDVLPLFKKSEDFHHNDPDAPVDWSVHGTGGFLNVEYHLPRSPQLDVFLAANEEIGNPISDINAGTGLGCAQAQFNIKRGVRVDDAKAFIKPVLDRENLQLLTKSYVTKIIINGNNEATGVVFARNGKFYRASAKKEVILSAGSYNSPHLLMLSGIGPRKHLESLRIKVRSELEVGRLLEHPEFIGLTFNTNYTEPIKPLSEYVCEYLNGFGPLSVYASNQGNAYYESSFTKGTGLPDIEIQFRPANSTPSDLTLNSYNINKESFDVLWKNSKRTNAFTVLVFALHSQSEGTVRLKSGNPFDYPLIDFNLLSDPRNKDIETLYEGIQIALKLIESNAFKKINATLDGGPLKACRQYKYKSKDYWYCALRQLTTMASHPVGTSRMGPDPKRGAVVDSQCRVYGVKKLRVADASVIPFLLSGYPNAPTVMVAEKVSELILLQHS